MTHSSNKISTVQAVLIVTNFILASGILTLPRKAAEAVKTPDVWISIIISGGIAILLGIIMAKLSQCYPDKTFYEYSAKLMGKWLGMAVSICFVIYFCILSAYEVRIMAEVTGYLILEGTPSWAITIPFLWVGYYLLIGGITSIARLFEVIFPITIIVFLLVIAMSKETLQLNNLRPVLGLGFSPVLKGLKPTILSFIGIEIILFIVAFMEKPKRAVRAVTIGSLIPIFFYIIILLTVIAALSVNGVVHRTWPTLDLIRGYEIKGLLFERFESFLLIIWTMQIFATFVITYFAASLGIFQVFKVKERKVFLGLLPVLFFISMIPKTLDEVFMIGDMLGKAAVILCGVLPLPLLILAKWKGRMK
nr:GerAB/ArcD/ProY family transporter [Bacillus mediterraneensis]